MTELRDSLDDSKASYGYARVSYANDKESKREKFILIVCLLYSTLLCYPV